MIYDIFISYSREDRESASNLANCLTQEGFSVWWDRKIPSGKSFEAVIQSAIDQSKCVIVLWSNQSVESDWVKEEASLGKSRNTLIPILIDNVSIPLGFGRTHTANLVDWNFQQSDLEFKKLIEDIHLMINQKDHKLNVNISDSSFNKKTIKEKKESIISKVIKISKFVVPIFIVVYLIWNFQISPKNCDDSLIGTIYLNSNNDIIPKKSVTSWVKLQDDSGAFIDSVLVDAKGKFQFQIDCTMDYEIIAKQEGFNMPEVGIFRASEKTNDIDLFLIEKQDVENILEEETNTEERPGEETNIEESQIYDYEISIDINPIFYDYDKFNIRTDAKYELENIVSVMRELPEIKISIESHTSTLYPQLHAIELSNRRAQSARDYIISRGIDINRIPIAIGYGSYQLLNHCDFGVECSPIEHQLNERTNIRILN